MFVSYYNRKANNVIVVGWFLPVQNNIYVTIVRPHYALLLYFLGVLTFQGVQGVNIWYMLWENPTCMKSYDSQYKFECMTINLI